MARFGRQLWVLTIVLSISVRPSLSSLWLDGGWGLGNCGILHSTHWTQLNKVQPTDTHLLLPCIFLHALTSWILSYTTPMDWWSFPLTYEGPTHAPAICLCKWAEPMWWTCFHPEHFPVTLCISDYTVCIHMLLLMSRFTQVSVLCWTWFPDPLQKCWILRNTNNNIPTKPLFRGHQQVI